MAEGFELIFDPDYQPLEIQISRDPIMKAFLVTRYPFCVLLSAIGWCGALANILHYAWFLRSHLSDTTRYFPEYHLGFWWGIGEWAAVHLARCCLPFYAPQLQ